MTAYSDLITGTSGLTNYWRFEGNGTATTGSLNMTIASGYSTSSAGKDGNGLTADSNASKTGCYCSVANTFFNSAYSIELWFKAGQHRSSQQEIMRMSNELALEIDTAGKLYYYYNGGADGTSSASVDDNAWHHLVVTRDGSRVVKAYIDGSQVFTFTAATGAPGSANLYVAGSQYSTQPFITGQVDEVALYNTALSSTTVTNHFNAMKTYVDVSTATISTNVYALPVDVETVTVSTNIGTLIDAGPTKTVYPSSDYVISGGAVDNTTPILVNSVVDRAIFAFTLPSDFTNTGKRYAQFTYNIETSGGGPNFVLAPITAPISDPTNPTLGSTIDIPDNVGQWTIDVTSLIATGSFYGFAIYTNSGTPNTTFSTVEHGTTSLRPRLEIGYDIVVVNETVDVDTVTASVAANDVTLGTGTTVTETTATASLSAYDVTVEATTSPDVTVDVSTVTASLAAHDATVLQTADITVATATASLDVDDVTVEVTTNAVIELDSPRILYTHIQVTDVQGQPIVPTEAEDPYFVSTMLNGPTYWQRFNDMTAPPVPRVYGGETNLPSRAGTFIGGGVDVGLNDGPNGRKYVHFDGTGFYEDWEHFPSSGDAFGFNAGGAPYTGTVEFSIRTNKKTQFLMRSWDRETVAGQVTSGSNSNLAPRDLWLIDGKLTMKVWWASPTVYLDTRVQYTWNTSTDLADGEWHHIVLAGQDDPPGDLFTEPRMNIYVDGDFEARRRGPGFGFPDYIAAHPQEDGRFGGYLPQSQWYEGDICEVVQYMNRYMNEDSVHVQYDNIFGFQPYYAEAARASITSVDATVKSNTKRVLSIDMRPPSLIELHRTTYRTGSVYKIDGQQFGFSTPAGGNSLTSGYRSGVYQMFYIDAQLPYKGREYQNPSGRISAGAYDERTDELRLVDLEIDVDLEDFDIITIMNWPTSSNDFEFYDSFYGGPAQYGGLSGRQQIDKIIHDVKQFAIDGKGVFISDPAVAARFGIISDVEAVPTLFDTGDRSQNYGHSRVYGRESDLRAAVINPWGANSHLLHTTNVAGDGPQPVTPNVEYESNMYLDSHANWKQRVVNLVDGLTDIPGDILVDSLSYSGLQTTALHEAEKWEHRPNGLSIGDEFWIMGTPGAGRAGGVIASGYGFDYGPIDSRTMGFPATPASAIKAGVMVTAFGETIWQRNEVVDNPYKDYAVSIAVRPGDLLDGQIMKGRIFVSFTEGFVDLATSMMQSTWQIVPPNEQLRTEWQEGEYAREWSWSSWRGSWADAQVGGGSGSGESNIVIDGDNVIITPLPSDALVGMYYTPRYTERREPAPSLHYRGFTWVGGDFDDDGSATVGLETAKVSAKTNEATAEVQRSEDVTVGTARINTESYVDADTVGADVTVLVTTPSLTIEARPYIEAVDLDTAVITARSYDDADGIILSKDWAVLRLPSHTAYVALEDK